jgi:hypothetical protein
MTISWYSISISPQSGGETIFNGYFSVDNTTNLVTSFYETINGSTNFNNNILGPNPFPSPFEWYTAQNTYTNNDWGLDGTNISSVTLQTAYNTDTPYFSIYGNNILWRENDLTNNMLITAISGSCYYHTFYKMNANDATVMTRTIYNNDGVMQETRNISFGGMLIKNVLSLIDGGGTNPYAIGIVDSSLNKIRMDIAYCDVYTKAWTPRQCGILMTYVNTTYKEPHTIATTIYTVTVSENAFWLATNDGTAVTNPSLLLTYGNMYLFDQSHSSNAGYPLTINTNSNYTSRYSTGVVTNGTPGSLNAYTLIDLDSSVAGANLYYGCVSLSGGLLVTE